MWLHHVCCCCWRSPKICVIVPIHIAVEWLWRCAWLYHSCCCCWRSPKMLVICSINVAVEGLWRLWVIVPTVQTACSSLFSRVRSFLKFLLCRYVVGSEFSITLLFGSCLTALFRLTSIVSTEKFSVLVKIMFLSSLQYMHSNCFCRG